MLMDTEAGLVHGVLSVFSLSLSQPVITSGSGNKGNVHLYDTFISGRGIFFTLKIPAQHKPSILSHHHVGDGN